MGTINDQLQSGGDSKKIYINYLLKNEAEALSGEILAFLAKVNLDINASQNDGHSGHASDFRVYGGELEDRYRKLYYTRAWVLKDLIVAQLGLEDSEWRNSLFRSINSEFSGEKIEHIDQSVHELLHLAALLSTEPSIHPVKSHV